MAKTTSDPSVDDGGRRGLAARAAHWSDTHRKTAIFGWLGFVVVAVMLGTAVGKEEIHGADAYSGDAGRAEQALYSAGLRPNDESVLVQSETQTIKDPEFQATIKELGEGLSGAEDVKNVELPPANGSVSLDGRSALVDFEITGDDLEARDRIAPSRDVVDNVHANHPDLLVEQFGSVSSNKELQEVFTSDLLKAEQLSLPITLLILVIAFASIVAALVPLLVGVTAVMA